MSILSPGHLIFPLVDRVSKGTTVLLYSEKNWKGRELLIDADASFLGLDMNDRCIQSFSNPGS